MSMISQNIQPSKFLSQTPSTDIKPKVSRKPKKPPKLHSSDLPYLQILIWFKSKGRKCYLTKAQWPQWLVNFGGKDIHYRKQKERWRKMRGLGYIETKAFKGKRNQEMDHFITQAGIEAVDNFIKARSLKSKNGPSRIKKRPLENKKTAPHLQYVPNHENKHAYVIKKLEKEDPEKANTYRRLQEFGFYPEVALKTMAKYTRIQIYQAYNQIKEKEKKPNNPGAYMTGILEKLYG